MWSLVFLTLDIVLLGNYSSARPQRTVVPLTWQVLNMAGVTDGFWFFQSNVSHSDTADCGGCCRSSCGSNTRLVSTQFGRVLEGARSTEKADASQAKCSKTAATELTSNNVFPDEESISSEGHGGQACSRPWSGCCRGQPLVRAGSRWRRRGL